MVLEQSFGEEHLKVVHAFLFSMLPLGGYVDLFGYTSSDKPQIWDAEKEAVRDYNDEERSVAFCFKPLWQRTLIVAMGPIVNFLLALVVLAGMFIVQGEHSTQPIVYAVAKNTPADQAGLKPLDEIIKLNGKKLERFEDIWEDSWTAGTTMIWTIKRGDEIFDQEITSVPVEYLDKKGIPRTHGRIGATNFSGVLLEEIMGGRRHSY